MIAVLISASLLGAQPSYISAKVRVQVKLDLTAEVEVRYELKGGGWPDIGEMLCELAEDASEIALQLLGSEPTWSVEADSRVAILRGEVEAPAVKLGLNTYELKLGGVEEEAVIGERRNLRLLEEIRVELASYTILEADPPPDKLAARSATWSMLQSGASVKFGFLKASLDITVYGPSPCSRPPELTEGCKYTALIQVESQVGVSLEVEMYIRGVSLRVSREKATLHLEPWGRSELEVKISPERGERWQLIVAIRDKARLEVLSSRILEGPIKLIEQEEAGVEEVEEEPKLLLSASASSRAEEGSRLPIHVLAFNAGSSHVHAEVRLKAAGCTPELQSREVSLPPHAGVDLEFNLMPLEPGQVELEITAEVEGRLVAESSLVVAVEPRQMPTASTPAATLKPSPAEPTPRELTPAQHPPPERPLELLALALALAAVALAALIAALILLLGRKPRELR